MYEAWIDVLPLHDTSSDTEKMLATRHFEIEGQKMSPNERLRDRLCGMDLEVTLQ